MAKISKSKNKRSKEKHQLQNKGESTRNGEAGKTRPEQLVNRLILVWQRELTHFRESRKTICIHDFASRNEISLIL